MSVRAGHATGKSAAPPALLPGRRRSAVNGSAASPSAGAPATAACNRRVPICARGDRLRGSTAAPGAPWSLAVTCTRRVVLNNAGGALGWGGSPAQRSRAIRKNSWGVGKCVIVFSVVAGLAASVGPDRVPPNVRPRVDRRGAAHAAGGAVSVPARFEAARCLLPHDIPGRHATPSRRWTSSSSAGSCCTCSRTRCRSAPGRGC
jgi:hypothetical protein